MNARELRIGNYVWLPGVKILHAITATSLYEGIAPYSSPVQLDADWFLDFGFEKRSNGCYLKNGLTLISFINDLTEWEPGIADENICNYNLKYVHELQNLFYALYKSELTKHINV